MKNSLESSSILFSQLAKVNTCLLIRWSTNLGHGLSRSQFWVLTEHREHVQIGSGTWQWLHLPPFTLLLACKYTARTKGYWLRLSNLAEIWQVSGLGWRTGWASRSGNHSAIRASPLTAFDTTLWATSGHAHLLLEGLLFSSSPILCCLKKDGLVNTLVRSHGNNSKHTYSWICAVLVTGAATWLCETHLCSWSLMTSWDWKYKSWNGFREKKECILVTYIAYVSWCCHSMSAPSCVRSRHQYEHEIWSCQEFNQQL